MIYLCIWKNSYQPPAWTTLINLREPGLSSAMPLPTLQNKAREQIPQPYRCVCTVYPTHGRLEAACRKTLSFTVSPSYKRMSRILAIGADRAGAGDPNPSPVLQAASRPTWPRLWHKGMQAVFQHQIYPSAGPAHWSGDGPLWLAAAKRQWQSTPILWRCGNTSPLAGSIRLHHRQDRSWQL